ncbi:hypothetical protein ScPMuIL_003699 [Solemya velum]
MSATNAEESEISNEETDPCLKTEEQQPGDVSPEYKSKEPTGASASVTESKTKVDLLLKPAGDAPIMKKKKWAVEYCKKVSWISEFLRKYLKFEPSESIFLYVNQSFSPAPDTEVGTLFECFGSDGKLVLHYCKSAAWG